MKNFIEVTELKKVFGSGEDEVHAFGPATININSGEFVCFRTIWVWKINSNAYGCWIIRFNKWKSRI